MLGKTERTGKLPVCQDFPYPNEIFLAFNTDRIYLNLKKISALKTGQFAFAEFFLKAQLVYINLQILYNSQKYFKLNLLALYDVKNFAFIAQ